MSGKGTASRTEILNGWKEIADYLGKGVRTVQRYERELGLPLHRPAGKATGAVFANKRDLDRWITTGPARRTHRLTDRANKVGADFLRIDSEVALTFSGIALQTTDEEKSRRTRRIAREAYFTIMHIRKNIDLSKADSEKLDANLQRLKSELQLLGESL